MEEEHNTNPLQSFLSLLIINYVLPPLTYTQGLISKRGAAQVVHRCLPGASEADLRYFLSAADAALPQHTALSAQDLEYVVRQGAAVEQQVAEGRIAPQARKLLASLADRFLIPGPQRLRAQAAFRDLDFNRSGMISTPEQLELLRALSPAAMRPSEALWLAACLQWYGSR